MQDDAVRHGDVIADDGLGTGIDMNDGIVLHAGSVADDDRAEVRTDGNARRDQTFVPEADVAD